MSTTHPDDWKGRFEAVLDYSHNAEDCEACYALEDACPYHIGLAEGVEWVAQHLARISADMECLNKLAVKPTRRRAS